MRFLTPAGGWEGFDQRYFANAGPAQIRRAHWGDLARITLLYVAPHRWLVRDYAERLYNHPAIAQTRCASILPALMINTTERPAQAGLDTGGLWVLENPARRLVGAATVTPPDLSAQAHAPIIDFLVAPAYLGQAPELLAAALDACRSGARNACAAAWRPAITRRSTFCGRSGFATRRRWQASSRPAAIASICTFTLFPDRAQGG